MSQPVHGVQENVSPAPSPEQVPQGQAQDQASLPEMKVYEGLKVEVRPAPALKRVLAYAVDVGILSSILYATFLVGVMFFMIATAATVSAVPVKGGENPAAIFVVLLFGLLALLVFATVWHGYFAYFEYKKGGQTLGKRLFGLKVVKLDSSPLTLWDCIVRDLFRYIDCGLVLPGLISMFATERKQRIGDLVCGTVVVYSSQREKKHSFKYLAQEQYDVIRERVQPGPVDRHVRKEYLKFAYHEFIVRDQYVHPEAYTRYEQWLKTAFPRLNDLDLDQRTILLFFAEHCHQLENSEG